MNKYRHRKRGESTSALLLSIARKRGVLSASDLPPYKAPGVVLNRLYREGRLNRTGRGLYSLPNVDLSEHHTLAEVAKRIPHGIVCLLSALRFHKLTTQSPYEIWVSIDVKARKPRIDSPRIHFVRFSGAALTHGIEKIKIEGVPVQITSPAKTVADCFKYRNKIGVDIAIEALKDYRRARKSMGELWKAAQICRVAVVMRPYMEAVE